MTNAIGGPEAPRACAMRYEIAAQTVRAGESLRLPAWEVHGEGILAEGGESLLLAEGAYLLCFSCRSEDAGAALCLNNARLAYLESSPLPGTQRIALQGLLRLCAPGRLRVVNSGAQGGQYREAVLTVLRLE